MRGATATISKSAKSLPLRSGPFALSPRGAGQWGRGNGPCGKLKHRWKTLGCFSGSREIPGGITSEVTLSRNLRLIVAHAAVFPCWPLAPSPFGPNSTDLPDAPNQKSVPPFSAVFFSDWSTIPNSSPPCTSCTHFPSPPPGDPSREVELAHLPPPRHSSRSLLLSFLAALHRALVG